MREAYPSPLAEVLGLGHSDDVHVVVLRAEGLNQLGVVGLVAVGGEHAQNSRVALDGLKQNSTLNSHVYCRC